MGDGFVCSYADILYRESIVRRLLESPGEIVLAVDTDWRARYSGRSQHPEDDAEKVLVEGDRVRRVARDVDPAAAYGEYIGLAKLGPAGAAALREHYHREAPALRAGLPDRAAAADGRARGRRAEGRHRRRLLRGRHDRGLSAGAGDVAVRATSLRGRRGRVDAAAGVRARPLRPAAGPRAERGRARAAARRRGRLRDRDAGAGRARPDLGRRVAAALVHRRDRRARPRVRAELGRGALLAHGRGAAGAEDARLRRGRGALPARPHRPADQGLPALAVPARAAHVGPGALGGGLPDPRGVHARAGAVPAARARAAARLRRRRGAVRRPAHLPVRRPAGAGRARRPGARGRDGGRHAERDRRGGRRGHDRDPPLPAEPRARRAGGARAATSRSCRSCGG